MRTCLDAQLLSVVKDDHVYIFRYYPGNEVEVLDEISSQCADPNCRLTWAEAAVLSLQIPDPAARDQR